MDFTLCVCVCTRARVCVCGSAECFHRLSIKSRLYICPKTTNSPQKSAQPEKSSSVSQREGERDFASLCKIILCVQLDLLSCCVKSE